MSNVGFSNAVAFLCFFLCFSWLIVPGQCDSQNLPPITPLYHTVVSAGFGNLNFSLHYYEYGNSTGNLTHSTGRYYSPDIQELTDFPNNAYSVNGRHIFPDDSCRQYSLDSVSNNRLVEGATRFLVDIAGEQPFILVGPTSAVRSQWSMQYHAQRFTLNDSAVVNQFVQRAYATAGAVNSLPSNLDIAIDVYYSSDFQGNLNLLGGTAIPLRFSINGTQADGSVPLEIVYDFMNWALLDPVTGRKFFDGFSDCDTTEQSHPLQNSTSLSDSDHILPIRYINDSTRITLELSISAAGQNQTIHLDSFLVPPKAKEMLTSLNSTTMIYNSSMFLYNTSGRPYSFSHGIVWRIPKNIIPDPFNPMPGIPSPSCERDEINFPNFSPLQWLYGGSLNTLLAKPSALEPAKYLRRGMIRGIVADIWALNFTATSPWPGASITYVFTLEIYVTATGWTNMGRIIPPSMGPQFLRFAYDGHIVTATTQAHYTIAMDFFMQYSWNVSDDNFDPIHQGCGTLPPLAQSEDNNINPALIIGVVVAIVGGMSVLAVVAAVYRWKRRQSNYFTSERSRGNIENDVDMSGVGRVDDQRRPPDTAPTDAAVSSNTKQMKME